MTIATSDQSYISDVDPDPDPDPVGSGFIWVCGSGSGSGFRIRIRIRIQRHKITDKMKGKAEFNQQKSLFSQEIICFNSEPLKK